MSCQFAIIHPFGSVHLGMLQGWLRVPPSAISSILHKPLPCRVNFKWVHQIDSYEIWVTQVLPVCHIFICLARSTSRRQRGWLRPPLGVHEVHLRKLLTLYLLGKVITYIPVGLWWNRSNETGFISFVKRSSMNPVVAFRVPRHQFLRYRRKPLPCRVHLK